MHTLYPESLGLLFASASLFYITSLAYSPRPLPRLNPDTYKIWNNPLGPEARLSRCRLIPVHRDGEKRWQAQAEETQLTCSLSKKEFSTRGCFEERKLSILFGLCRNLLKHWKQRIPKLWFFWKQDQLIQNSKIRREICSFGNLEKLCSKFHPRFWSRRTLDT